MSMVNFDSARLLDIRLCLGSDTALIGRNHRREYSCWRGIVIDIATSGGQPRSKYT